jgi:hypothetical protein
MNRDTLKHMRLDRRLIGRRGWIAADELAVELERLPDVSDKKITLGEAGDQGEAARAGSASTVLNPGVSEPSSQAN